ncbi:MAG: hypothetical protein ACRCT8_10245 [Lacipirellulaceae bacterium]
MSTDAPQRDPVFGYLLVVEDAEHGFTGGYLVVSHRGRPLEFHCTEPLRTSRAQEILFGPTLRPYIVGEQVGATLLGKAKLKADLLLVTDADAALAGRIVGIESLLVAGEATAPSDRQKPMVDLLAESIDVAEPFERVREAILEAQRLGAGEQAGAEAA